MNRELAPKQLSNAVLGALMICLNEGGWLGYVPESVMRKHMRSLIAEVLAGRAAYLSLMSSMPGNAPGNHNSSIYPESWAKGP